MSDPRQAQQLFVQEDLARVVTAKGLSKMDLTKLENTRVLITGASGFMGLWLTEVLLYLAHNHGVKLKLLLLARDFTSAKLQAPHLYEDTESVTILADNVRSIHELPTDVNWVIHAAASPDLRVHNSQPLHSSRTIAQGTQTMLECASRLPMLKGFLNVSSGYVYGYHSAGNPIAERDFDGFDPSGFSNAYLEAKRYAESLCAIFRNQYRLPIFNVRPFSFIGPYQPIDAPWAVNNFIANVVGGQPIRIQGDGTAVRSYMYGADMAWWMLNFLLSGEPGFSYNLGSSEAISLVDLAEKIRQLAASDVTINKGKTLANAKKSFFVPSVDRVRGEFGLGLEFGLDEALSRTLRWYKQAHA